MQKERDLSFDAFRGLAIIAVVAIHATSSGYSCGYRNLHFIVVYRQLLNFAVPAFLFISGYWLSRKPIKSLEDYKSFLIRRLSRILIPYLFWSSILIGHALIKTHDISVHKIIFTLLIGGASDPYYFIILLAQLYIMTPLLQYINRKSYGLVLVLTLNIISLLSLYILRLHFNWSITFYWYILPFYSWVIFYEAGLLVGGRDKKIFIPKNAYLFILAAIFISLLISRLEGTILLLKYNNLRFAVTQVKYSSFLYSACIILGFLFVREHFRYWPKLLIAIGNYSFGIYLIHVIVLNKVVNIVQKSNTIYSLQPLYQPIVVLITILICFILISAARELLPKSFCRKVLGF